MSAETAAPAVERAAGADGRAALPGLAELADHIELLTREARFAALEGNVESFAGFAERLLPLHVEWARRYREWQAARVMTAGPVRSGY